MLGEILLGDQQHEAEAARIVVGDGAAALHVEDDMVVRCARPAPR